MVVQADRSLEVVVLAGRGLSGAVPAGGRRKVQITLVSARDPLGEAFGAKVSPWTVAGNGRALRFGTSGLKCSFPLSGRRGAPSIAADARFADSACIRVRLLASQVSTKSSMMRAAAELLPTSVMTFANQEIDEGTAQIEAEVKVPLTNILAGRVGQAADRAVGGWVPLRSMIEEEEGPISIDEIPPAIWMQMYVLPDHEALLSKLQAQLNEETTRQGGTPAGAPALRTAALLGHAPARPNPPATAANAGSQSGGQRWGPNQKAVAAPAQVVNDLIDVDLMTLEQPTSLNLLDDLDGLLMDSSSSSIGVGGLPSLGQDLPHLGAFSAASSSQGLPVASGFGFVQQGYAAQMPVMAPAPAAAPASAFGFIAGGSGQGSQGAASLDLASLYASSVPPKASSSSANYSALGFLDLKSEPAKPKAAAAPGSLESLEQSILADLKF